MQTEYSGVSTSGSDTDGSYSDTDNNDEYIASSDSSCLNMDISDEV